MKRDKRTQGMNWIRQDKRLAIYIRDGFACMWYGESVENGAQLSLDHVKCYVKKGSNSERNLICSCMSCNRSRGTRKAEDFAEVVANYKNHGLTAEKIMSSIRSNTRKSIKEFRAEAKVMIDRRCSAAKVLDKIMLENK